MRFWGAVAVQLLAIALRDHSRVEPKGNLDLCLQRPVELACHCEPAVPPKAETDVDHWWTGIGVLAGAGIGGLISGTAVWWLVTGRDVPSQHGGGSSDVEEACYLGLKPGSRILLWYADDSVWHEALVGLVLGGEEIVMYTPDKDLYVEAVGCKGDYGPIRLRGLLPNGNLPRNLRARAYRFREKVTDELIRQVFRDALSLADGEDRHYTMPTQAVNQAFEVVSIDALFGGKFLRTRLPRGRGREEVPDRHDGGSPVGTPKNAKVVEPAMGDYVWVSAEPLGGLILGQEVSLNAETDVQCGPRHAMATSPW